MRYSAELAMDSFRTAPQRENEPFTLLYQAVQDLRWKDPFQSKEVPARVLGTLLVFSYFREMYSSAEIALTAQADPALQYICTRAPLDSNRLRAFRRANRPMIEHALATLVRLVSVAAAKPVTPNPLAEAKRRVDLAVRCDCFEQDE